MEKKSITLEKLYADAFKMFLKTNKIKYYPSEDGDYIYYSIETTTEMVSIIDAFLDGLYKIYNKGYIRGCKQAYEDMITEAKVNARVNTNI